MGVKWGNSFVFLVVGYGFDIFSILNSPELPVHGDDKKGEKRNAKDGLDDTEKDSIIAKGFNIPSEFTQGHNGKAVNKSI